jgi:hypothetical protein
VYLDTVDMSVLLLAQLLLAQLNPQQLLQASNTSSRISQRSRLGYYSIAI